MAETNTLSSLSNREAFEQLLRAGQTWIDAGPSHRRYMTLQREPALERVHIVPRRQQRHPPGRITQSGDRGRENPVMTPFRICENRWSAPGAADQIVAAIHRRPEQDVGPFQL